jgi:hypothetical protein
MRNTLHYTVTFASLITFIFLIVCCTNKRMDCSFGNTILDTMSNDKLESNNRAYNYTGYENKPVTFTIIYKGDLSDMITDDSSNFKALLETYGFRIEQPFEINTEMKGIVLVSSSKFSEPINIGKELSLVNEVMMVEVSNTKIYKEIVS